MLPEAEFSAATVLRIAEPVEDVRVFELAPQAGARPYALGSHIVLRISGELQRCYSLVGEAPENGAYRIAVRRVAESRGGSRHLWSLRSGAQLRISQPRSCFELRPGAPEYLLAACGIGITPFVGMAQALVRRGARVRLVYVGRDRRRMAFLPELEALLGERLALFVRAEGSCFELARELEQLHPHAELYLCGPLDFMEAARAAWHAAGRPLARLRIETFGSSGHRPAEPFEVLVRDRARTLRVARDQSLLESLAACGIELPGHCGRGECGLCAVEVLALAGEIDHRDVFLSAQQRAEGKLICPCVSRAVGQISIDTGYRATL